MEEKPVDEQPAQEQPAEKPVEEKPVDEQPAQEQPNGTEQQPTPEQQTNKKKNIFTKIKEFFVALREDIKGAFSKPKALPESQPSTIVNQDDARRNFADQVHAQVDERVAVENVNSQQNQKNTEERVP